MKKIVVLIIALIFILTGGFLIYKQAFPKAVHFHAGFQVYNNNVLQNFSYFTYMDSVPCTVNGIPVKNGLSEQLAKAHLHDGVGDVVHVHRSNATWGDLFKNIHYPVPANTQAYVNGKQIQDILSQPIHPYESTIIFIGNHSPIKNYLKNAVTLQHIKDIEKHSETCSS